MDFDVVVIGGGVGGLASAIRSAELGKKVAIVERDVIGGECVNRACIPSKTLIDAVKLVSRTRKSPWIKANASIDYEILNQHKNKSIEAIRNNLLENLRKHNITVIAGEGKVNEHGEVQVGEKTITFDNLVIATGSSPISLADFPLNGRNVLDPWTAMNLPSLPNSIVIVGGGVAGVELATLFRALGKEVTILELMPQLLPGFDKDIASETKKRLEENGVKIYLQAKSKIVDSKDKVKFSVSLPSSSETVEGDLAVITIGRKANNDNLGLNNLKVETDQRGYIKVDGRTRTSNSRVYAVGDCAGMPLSATKAWKQGIVAGDNIGGKDSVMPKYIPISIFADLEIGLVGKSLDDVKKEGVEATEVKVEMREIPRAWTVNETEGFLKVVVDKEGKILGAHMIGEGATEIINTMALAMEGNLTMKELYKVSFSHPTLTEVISEVAQRFYHGELY
ncbi:MAG: dihydrolipoamide dehydrogenase [Candidatus Aramenus sulfurataquae]|uniref:Dihydrolipoyl dehydrogenase n=1 Tax=Candidatus Aramenus sulfurataquae TaxID=1326980 RepID=W7KZ44_9CREN|nr:MAG: dihydrolipoamide dehydrogenase [Candidatus Aramenus sulfurataquae]